MSTRILTGITTSGIPHLGNYAGAIQPAIQMSRQTGNDAFFFMADYHALVKCDDPERVARSRQALAATWLAAGLDTDKATFYRQSDIPEIPELNWILSCVTSKGLMNRAHAYKAAQDQNAAKGIELDDGVTMGLYCYPVLMSADILIFNANKVPVGRDQVQHLEMARDIAQRFNHMYGETFVLPEVQIAENVAILPGLDGRKMSKSYDNTIPLFESSEAELKAAIMRIVTDSRQPGEPKDAESSMIFQIYKGFASDAQTTALKAELERGMGWGDAKNALFTLLNDHLAPMRDRYQDLLSRPDDIEDILLAGAAKARQHTEPLMERVRDAVGLRKAKRVAVSATAEKKAARKGRFVSFREEEGFRFRLLDAAGTELLVSEVFADPRQAGMAQKALAALNSRNQFEVAGDEALVVVEGAKVASLPAAELDALLETLEGMRAE